MVGAIAGLALATLTANAGSTATPRVSGSLVSLLAATTTVTRVADREAAAGATPRTPDRKAARPAARTECMPQPTAACQAALAGLQALVPATRPESWSELVRLPNQIDQAGLRAAFIAVATACAHRD